VIFGMKLNVYVIAKIRLVLLLMTIVMLMTLPICFPLNIRNYTLAFRNYTLAFLMMNLR